MMINIIIIPKQFTVKAYPALFEGRSQKNEGLLFQSTIDIHILNIFLLTVDIHFQNMLLLPLSLLLCSLLLPNCEGSHSVRLLYCIAYIVMVGYFSLCFPSDKK